MVTPLLHYIVLFSRVWGWGGRGIRGQRDQFYVLIIAPLLTVCDSSEDSECSKPTHEKKQDTHTHTRAQTIKHRHSHIHVKTTSHINIETLSKVVAKDCTCTDTLHHMDTRKQQQTSTMHWRIKNMTMYTPSNTHTHTHTNKLKSRTREYYKHADLLWPFLSQTLSMPLFCVIIVAVQKTTNTDELTRMKMAKLWRVLPFSPTQPTLTILVRT